MDVVNRLDRLVHQHPLCLFMRGEPEQATCQGSADLLRILRQCSAEFHTVNVQSDPEIRAFLGKFSDVSDVPQVFLNGEFLGTAQVVSELHQQGELKPMIESCAGYRLAG